MYITQGSERRESELGWTVDTLVSPPIHENLTAAAVGALGLSSTEQAHLRDGVRDPDLGSLANHCRPSEQARHFLRRHQFQSVRAAYGDAIRLLRALHSRILASPPTSRRFFFQAGQALHLIQDSFSAAHVSRRGGVHEITYIRTFNCVGRSVPVRDHGFPADPRDLLSRSAAAAAAIQASFDFLRMILRDAGRLPASSGIPRDLNHFIGLYLRLSGAPAPAPPAPSSPPVEQPPSSTPPTGRPELRHGSKGAYVRFLQKSLNLWLRSAGLEQLVVDGDFGRKTKVAVRSFQRAHGLAVDGIVGPITWGALTR